MGFDLWRTLGVSPTVGIGAAVGGIVAAVILAVVMAVRRSRSSHVLRTGIGQDG